MMNRTKIEWTDYTWNPITGCKSTCEYCYARALSRRFKWSFEPTFHPERLSEPYTLKTPSKIFVCSMADIFGGWIEKFWFNRILRVIYDNPIHIFQLLTKFPHNFHHFFSCDESRLPDNLWLGVTITCSDDLKKVNFLLDPFLKKRKHSIKFICFEPLLHNVDLPLGVDWIIIGGQSGRNAFSPPREWIDHILQKARRWRIPVFVKSNANYPEKIQEFPKCLK